MIELQRVTRLYGEKAALREVTLTAPDGCVLGLLGVNGAGKTTALSLMTGYLPPTAGRVLVDGADMAREPRRCKRAIGYLPEQPPLYDEMTVTDYLAFVSRLREVRSTSIPGHVRDIVRLCGLEEAAGRPLGKLSKGYRQRAGIASALCGDPPTIILDEPTVGLDPRQVVEIRGLIRALGASHTVIFSSHLLAEVQQLCTRVAILHQGRLVREADLNALDPPDTLRLHVRAEGAADRLIPALRSLPCVRRIRVNATEAGITDCVLECADARETPPPQARIFRLLSGLDAPLLLMAPEQDSLEALFLRVTAGEEADAP